MSNIFRSELVKLELDGKTKNEVFDELIGNIAGLYPKYIYAEMLNAVTAREKQMNTAVLPGIAVPHGYCNMTGGIIGAIGFSRGGIEYGMKEPIHAVFMLLMDKLSREDHLRVLSRLLEMLNSESFTIFWTSGSRREIYGILEHF
ncbi:MAG: PTS sugar transporter subunit IIA [Treponema sp.]|nr:PTS sugar transporter subunit IIA [Treponema sp.]